MGWRTQPAHEAAKACDGCHHHGDAQAQAARIQSQGSDHGGYSRASDSRAPALRGPRRRLGSGGPIACTAGDVHGIRFGQRSHDHQCAGLPCTPGGPQRASYHMAPADPSPEVATLLPGLDVMHGRTQRTQRTQVSIQFFYAHADPDPSSRMAIRRVRSLSLSRAKVIVTPSARKLGARRRRAALRARAFLGKL
jgi:hypothetical protein